jgi:hypothetical protein
VRRAVRKALHGLGYELRRIRPRATGLGASAAEGSAGTIIEITGASGVGKTSVYRKLRPALKGQWDFDVDRAIASTESASEHVPVYWRLFVDKMEQKWRTGSFAGGRDSGRTFAKARHYIDVIEADMAAHEVAAARRCVIEEGVCFVFVRELLAVADSGAVGLAEVEALLANRAVVFLDAGANFVEENLRRRHAASPGSRNDWIHRLGPEATRDFVRLHLEHQLTILPLLERVGCPILRVDAEKGVDASVTAIVGFAERLIAARAAA